MTMFDLTITFGGLCLLVRDPVNGALHVLMPDSTQHPHEPTLVYVDQTGVKKPGIKGMHLHLPSVTGSDPFSSDVPSEVFDFGGTLLGSRTVRKELLDPESPLPGGVSARMRITAGKHGLVRHPGGFWNFKVLGGPAPRRLPTTLDWIINNVDLPHLVIEDKVGGGRFEVFPDGANRIHILVVHVPEPELKGMGPDVPGHSGCPDNEHPAEHFGFFSPLLTPGDPLTLPEFDGPTSHAHGLCSTRLRATHHTSHAHGQATAVATVAAVAAAAAAAAVLAPVNPRAAMDAGAVAAVAAEAATAALTATDARAAGGSAGSELTCMITTAPAG
jgi:hypothetical protein